MSALVDVPVDGDLEFLGESDDHMAAVEEGIRQADAGDLGDFDDVKKRAMERLAALNAGR